MTLRIDELPLMRHWHIVHLSHRVLSPAAETFRHFVLESGGGFVQRHFGNLQPPDGETAPAATRRRRARPGRGRARQHDPAR